MFLVSLTLVYGVSSGQKTCTSNPTTIGSNINFTSITWTASGGATVTECNNMANGTAAFTGNVIVDVSNNRTITISNNVTINGNFPISGGPGSTLSVTGGRTLQVSGDLGDAANNGVQYNVATASDRIIVGGTLYGKNNNAFTGSGSISGGTLDVKNGSTCGSPCPVSGGFSNCTSSDGFCSTYTVLPVTLISFSARVKSKSVELLWATASELNFDFFSIERSTNGVIFEEIGRVSGHGYSTSRIDYSFVDAQPLSGRSYYRLVTYDYDGYTESFEIVSVDLALSESIAVYPNPVIDGRVNIDLNYQPANPVVIVVTDLNGMEVWRGKTVARTSSISVELVAGTYLMKFISAEVDESVRILVR